VYGVLEDHWTDEIDVRGGTDLAIRAVNVAMRRDAASGEGIDVAVITRQGFHNLQEADVQQRKTAMKLP
jgi:proteasome beta subunit